MYLEPSFKRSELSAQQKEFLVKLIPFARSVQDQVREKCNFAGYGGTVGLKASIFIALVINELGWNSETNNLLNLKINKYWKGKSDGEYKKFNSWHEFTTHYSDLLAFDHSVRHCFLEENTEKQLKLFLESTLQNDNPMLLWSVIEDYGLEEFDIW